MEKTFSPQVFCFVVIKTKGGFVVIKTIECFVVQLFCVAVPLSLVALTKRDLSKQIHSLIIGQYYRVISLILFT